MRAETEEQMDQIRGRAKAAGLPTFVVIDEGRTQIACGSRTVLAIGALFLTARSLPDLPCESGDV